MHSRTHRTHLLRVCNVTEGWRERVKTGTALGGERAEKGSGKERLPDFLRSASFFSSFATCTLHSCSSARRDWRCSLSREFFSCREQAMAGREAAMNHLPRDECLEYAAREFMGKLSMVEGRGERACR